MALTALLLALSTPASSSGSESAASPILPFSHQLTARSDGIPFAIKATRSLTQLPDGTWELTVLASNWLGEIRETTRFDWQSCTPRSSQWSYLRRGLGQEREAQVMLNRSAGTATATRGERRREYPINEDTTDKLSQTLALQCLLEQGEEQLALDVADERGRETVQYRIKGEQWLDTDAGRLRTVVVERVREQDSHRKTLLWFAADHQHALVKLVQVEDDKTHHLEISQL